MGNSSVRGAGTSLAASCPVPVRSLTAVGRTRGDGSMGGSADRRRCRLTASRAPAAQNVEGCCSSWGRNLPRSSGSYAVPMNPVRATRYVTPLREGGSLPGLMEADDLGMYVVKFRGAGQGPRALVAEVICAEIAGAIGLPVPRWVPVIVPEELAPAEPDEEVQHLLKLSVGMNLGVDFLPGALDVGPMPTVDPMLAGADRVARCVDHQRGPLVAQPEHARVAPGAAADRSWGGADLPPLVGAGPGGPGASASPPGPTTSPTMRCSNAPRTWRPPTRTSPASTGRRVIAGAVAAVPDEWLVADSAAWGGAGGRAGGLPGVPHGPHRRTNHVGPGSSWRRSRAGRSAMTGGIGCQPGRARGRRSGSPS